MVQIPVGMEALAIGSPAVSPLLPDAQDGHEAADDRVLIMFDATSATTKLG